MAYFVQVCCDCDSSCTKCSRCSSLASACTRRVGSSFQSPNLFSYTQVDASFFRVQESQGSCRLHLDFRLRHSVQARNSRFLVILRCDLRSMTTSAREDLSKKRHMLVTQTTSVVRAKQAVIGGIESWYATASWPIDDDTRDHFSTFAYQARLTYSYCILPTRLLTAMVIMNPLALYGLANELPVDVEAAEGA